MSAEDEVVAGMRLVKGELGDEELAALVAVLAAATRPADSPRAEVDQKLVAGWKSYHRTVRNHMIVGREAWRNSYR